MSLSFNAQLEALTFLHILNDINTHTVRD